MNKVKSKGFVKKKKEVPSAIYKHEKVCVMCGKKFTGTAVAKVCGEECRKNKNNGHLQKFLAENPDSMKKYNVNRVAKDPAVWKKKWDRGRLEIIKALGGKCLVCNVTNPLWLHIDFVPTMVGSGFRHPRHRRWVLDHIAEFRLLCANHHYELTLTGKIEGTNIIQDEVRKQNKLFGS